MKITKRTDLKKLAEFLRVDKETARKIRNVITGKDEPIIYGRVERWVNQCYREPQKKEQIMTALDELLDGNGVEPIRGEWWDNYYGDSYAEYVNMGDSYLPTILLDHHTEEFHATTWGDWIETTGKKYGL